MDNAQLLMTALIVLIICLVVLFTNWNNYNNTKPVQKPQDASDDQYNQAYWNANYSRNANIAKVVGIVAAVATSYLYSQMSSSDVSCIWGGFYGGNSESDNEDEDLIVPIGTPSGPGM